MQKHYQEERELYITDYIWNVIISWRRVIILMVLFAILFAGIKYKKDLDTIQTSIETEANRENVLLENVKEKIDELSITDKEMIKTIIPLSNALITKKEYAENAKIMELDGYNVERVVLQYFVDSEKNTSELLQAYGNSYTSSKAIDRIIAATEYTMNPEDVLDMISVRNGANPYKSSELEKGNDNLKKENSTLNITVRGENKEAAEKMAETIKEILEEYSIEAENVYGVHNLILVSQNYNSGRDAEVVDIQKEIYDTIYSVYTKLDELKEELSEEASKFISEYETVLCETVKGEHIQDGLEKKEQTDIKKPTLNKKWILFGAVFGGLFVAAFEVLKWMFAGKMNSVRELQQNVEICVLGTMDKKHNYKFFEIVDKLIYRIKNRNEKRLDPDQELNLIATRISLVAKKNGVKEVYLTGTGIEQRIDCELLRKLCYETGRLDVKLFGGKDIVYDVEALVNAVRVKNVIMIEETQISKYRDIVRELQICKEQNINVLGAIIVAH